MRGAIRALDVWLDPTHAQPPRVYLDTVDWQVFLNWLAEDSDIRIQSLLDGSWRVCVFNTLLNRHFGVNGQRTKQLKALGIHLENGNLRDDEMFITEALRVYFDNDAGARPQAELLALARRKEGNGRIAVISQHPGFWRIPMVDTYFVTPVRETPDLPAQFDFFMDLDIHSIVRQAAERRMQHGDQPTALIETVKEFFEYVRQIIASTDDGHNLMKEAFSCQRWDQNLQLDPLVKLNNLSSQNEWNEQKGFRDIAYGVASALRNPLAHQPADRAFIQSRYGDKRKALKVLCFLSLLFEKVDERVP